MPLCNLGLSMADFAPCDRFVQMAISYTYGKTHHQVDPQNLIIKSCSNQKTKNCWFVLRLILVIKGINTELAHKLMCPVI